MFRHELVTLPEPLVENTNDGRFYVSPNGKRYPSVTTVIGYHTREDILKWKNRVGEEQANKVSRAAANRGTALHKVCENYLLNKEYKKDVMPTTLDLFGKIKGFLDDNITKVLAIETAMYSDYLKVGGRLDAAVNWNGRNSILDFKTASKAKKEEWIDIYFWQTAIYAVMFEERTGIPIPQIVIVMAPDDASPGQLFIKKRDDYINDAVKLIKKYYEYTASKTLP